MDDEKVPSEYAVMIPQGSRRQRTAELLQKESNQFETLFQKTGTPRRSRDSKPVFGHRSRDSRSYRYKSKTRSNKYKSKSNKYKFDQFSKMSEDDRFEMFNQHQKKTMYDILNDYVPEDRRNLATDDIDAHMDRLDKNGYGIPPGYDRRRDLDNENLSVNREKMRIEKVRSKKNIQYMINMGALGISTCAKAFNIDWLKTKYLTPMIRTAIEEGEFDESLDGIEPYIRGTILDDPLFVTGLKFAEYIGKAHQKEIDESDELMEIQMEERDKSAALAMKELAIFRKPKKEDIPSLNVPEPIEKKTPVNEVIVNDEKDDMTSLDYEKPRQRKRKTFNKISGMDIPNNVQNMVKNIKAPLESMKMISQSMDDEDEKMQIEDEELEKRSFSVTD